METAGKQVEDEELRDLMKENGIGRPSTRANIIETLFKRQYIRKDKKTDFSDNDRYRAHRHHSERPSENPQS